MARVADSFAVTPPVAPVPTANPGPPPLVSKGAAGGNPTLTLQALMQRQKDAAARAQAAYEQPAVNIPMGLAQMARSALAGYDKYSAEQQEAQGRAELAKIMAGIDPVKGPTQEQLGQIYARDPELGTDIYKTSLAERLARDKQEHWVSIPTPEGETGQWYQNSVTGETKKVGGSSEGGTKLSDLGSLRDDYTKAAAAYDQSSPTWTSMLDSWTRVKDLGEAEQSPGAGTADYNLVIGLAKIMDPNSVVREGEVETVRRTGGATDYLISYLANLTGGGSLSPAQRRGLMTEAQNRMKAYHGQAKEKRDWLSGVATRHNINPEDVVAPLGDLVLFDAEQQPDTTTPDTETPDTTTPAEDIPPLPPRPAWLDPNSAAWPKTPDVWKRLTPEQRADFIKWSTATQRPPEF